MKINFNPLSGKFDYTENSASKITNTPAGNIVATNVQTAIDELDTEKVAKAGDTMTGPLAIQSDTGEEGFKLQDGSTDKLAIKWVSNTVTLDIPSPEPANLLLNPTFDSDLTSWSEVPSYTLNDQFTTNLAAGAVNGTSAEPTGGTRTVTDTNSKLSISSSQLSFATGGVGNGNPGIWYPVVTRAAGKILIGDFNWSAKALQVFGFDTNQSEFGYDALIAPTSTDLTDGTYSIGTYATGTSYSVAVVLRSTGSYVFIKGGIYTSWTLLFIGTAGNTSTLYPGFSGASTGALTADNIRIPTSTWLPTPLAYDTFTRADGAIGSSETTGPDSQTTPSLAWTGGAISTNKNVITPSLGSDVVVNGDFASDTVWAKGAGWTIAGGVGVGTGVSGTYLQQNSIMTVGSWYTATWDLVSRTAGTVNTFFGGNNGTGPARSTPATYAESGRAIGNGHFYFYSGNGFSGTLDNVVIKPLTLSSLFSTVSTSDADVIADANVTLTAGTQAGLVLNLDSTSSPANFIIVYHDGTSVKVDEAVAGVYTNKQTTTVTYSAGATLRAIRQGTKLRVYYNNDLVGAELTMTANTNTKHGLFSTYSGNSFDNFTLWARGTGAEYTGAPFEELVATRDTGTKYAGTASAKLVAGGTDGTYLQSVNVGDTSTYTLIAYAYTTGAAVTTADLDLYYDTGELSTTFASMGSGWYRLTGTLTGVASAKDYGVRVHAGVTVYVDSFSLQAGTGVTTTFEMLNSGTGNLHHTVEGTSTFNAGVVTEQAIIAKGIASQTEDILEVQDSTGTVLANVEPDGDINTTGVVKVDSTQVVGPRVVDARADDVANSGDATTDGLIDALRDAMISHGLISAT